MGVAIRTSFLVGLGLAVAVVVVVVVFVFGGAACQTDTHSPTCDLQQQIAQPGTPLTLLPGARLERVGSGFLLMGRDGNLVRWAAVDTAGQVGAEQSAAVPATVAGPWFAAAGKAAAADTILIAYGTASASAGMGMVDVQVLAVPAVPGDGSGPPVVSGPLATIPDPSVLDGAKVIMGSGRMGRRAALAWSIPGAADVHVQSLDGTGQALGAPLVATATSAVPAPLVECLSFVAGQDDLAVGFVSRESTTDASPRWTIVDVLDTGGLDTSLTVRLGTADPTCPISAASGTAGGYVTAWQNEIGSWIGQYDGTTLNFDAHLFAGAVTFGGADVQPPLAGLGPVTGGDIAVVLAQPGAAEAWRVTTAGVAVPGVVIFPSNVGQMGEISTVSLSGSLYATYADYPSASSVGTAGQRFFIKISCF